MGEGGNSMHSKKKKKKISLCSYEMDDFGDGGISDVRAE